MIKKLLSCLILGAGPLLFATSLYAQKDLKVWRSSAEPLQEIEAIRKNIIVPVFKDQDYLLSDYGAVGDGVAKNTEAFKQAIEACHAKGGGRVIVPAGRYITGPIYLKSNVNLHLTEKAVIVFSQETADYPLVLSRWEGMDCMNYSPQIYAYQEKNIAVTGNGTIDGNADKENWWPWKGRESYGWKKGEPNQFRAREVLHMMMKERIDPRRRIFGDGHHLRPYMFQPYACENILLSGVKMVNSPMWFISPVMCENVIIEYLRVQSHGPNTDGCDPDACRNVLIRDCYFDTGDDCIAIKSGRDEDGRDNKRPAENHIIERCIMKNGHGGIVIGSEIAGGARNIYALDCQMSSPNLDRVLRVKTSSSRGGTIENIFLKGIAVGQYRDAALRFNMFYENPGEHIPIIRNIWIENLQVSDGGNYGIYVNAYAESPVQHLRFINSDIKGVKEAVKVNHISDWKLEGVRINGKLVTPKDLNQK